MICKPGLLWDSKQLFDHLWPKGKTQVSCHHRRDRKDLCNGFWDFLHLLPQMLSRMPKGHRDCWHLIVIRNLFLWVGNLGRLHCHPLEIASHLPDLQDIVSQICSHNFDVIILESSHNTLYCGISVTFRQVHLRQMWWHRHSFLQKTTPKCSSWASLYAPYTTRCHI